MNIPIMHLSQTQSAENSGTSGASPVSGDGFAGIFSQIRAVLLGETLDEETEDTAALAGSILMTPAVESTDETTDEEILVDTAEVVEAEEPDLVATSSKSKNSEVKGTSALSNGTAQTEGEAMDPEVNAVQSGKQSVKTPYLHALHEESVETEATDKADAKVNAKWIASSDTETESVLPEALQDVEVVNAAKLEPGPLKGPSVASMFAGISSDKVVLQSQDKDVLGSATEIQTLSQERSLEVSAVQPAKSEQSSPGATLRVPERVTVEEIPATMVKGVRYLITKGNGTITIKLYPESLGEVQVHVQQIDGEMQVRLSSISPVVREILEQGLLPLREALHQQGLDPGSIEVDSQPDHLWNPAEQSREELQDKAGKSNVFQDETAKTAMQEDIRKVSSGTATGVDHDGTLNLFI